jgi:hypothetical protein
MPENELDARNRLIVEDLLKVFAPASKELTSETEPATVYFVRTPSVHSSENDGKRESE